MPSFNAMYIGGHLDWGETIQQCIEREVNEECNVHVQYSHKLNITENIFHITNKHYITIFVQCRMNDTTQQIINNEPEQHSEWVWYNYDRLKQNPDRLAIFEPLQSFINENGDLDIFKQPSTLSQC